MSMFVSDTSASIETTGETSTDVIVTTETAFEEQTSESTAAQTPPDETVTEEETTDIVTSETFIEETSSENLITETAAITTAEPAVFYEPHYIDEYEDDNIKISLSQYRINDTDTYVADVELSSSVYLKTAFAYDTYGKNMIAATSEIADEHDAIFAVNGDYYGARETGFVIRNGILYRDTPKEDVLCIYADGSMKVIDPYSVNAEELIEQGVWQAFSFGPALVNGGNIAVSVDQEVRYSKVSNPRTAVGMIDKLHYVFVVSDVRTKENKGLSLYELADFMKWLRADTAYNLDGGGSSTMIFNGKLINKPTFDGENFVERKVSDIVYIG